MEENSKEKLRRYGKKTRLRLSTKRKRHHMKKKRNNWMQLQHASVTRERDSDRRSDCPTGPTSSAAKCPSPTTLSVQNSSDSSPSTSSIDLTIEAEMPKPKETQIDGRRIVDIGHIFETIKKIKHHPLGCDFTNLLLQSEVKQGFHSKFIFKCSMCNKQEIITTENETSNRVDVNTALVESMFCTGNGFSQLNEIAAAIDMPCMSNNTYYKIESRIQTAFEDCALDEMLAAGAEERRIAIQNGEVDAEGNALIPVAVDGSWAKRSYKSGYSSHSGAACIIGFRTKKVLFLSIRNNYCCICSRAKKKNIAPPEHKCFKNWSGTANAMEEDIIAEGFKQSLEMHGVKYNLLIGDGDSGVINKLLVTMPYGPNFLIKKVECKNHLLRNFSNKLKAVVKKTNNHVGHVPMALRTKLETNILRLRTAIVCAIDFRKDEELNEPQKIQNLKTDIRNAAYHVFGCHENCADYFCNRSSEENFVPEFEKYGIWLDIQKAVSTLVNNAGSLILDVTTNCAEQFHSIIAKYIGGKRVNYTARGSYQGRCFGAVTSWNSKAEHERLQNKLKKSPGQYTKAFTEKRRERLQYLRKRKSVIGRTDHSKAKKSRCEPDEHYGVQEVEDDMPAEIFEERKQEFLADIALSESDKQKIELETRGQSDNHLWKIERRKRLTASMFGRICKMRPTTSCLATLKTLLYSNFQGNTATNYGKQHESEAIRQFTQKTGLEVNSCGLFIDPNDDYIAASPDGLIGDDSLIEIKCPSSIEHISPIEALTATQRNGKRYIPFCQIVNGHLVLKRNHCYYYQVQGQLHVTGRKFCYFVVWSPKGMEYELIERNDEFWELKMKPNLKSFYFECLLPELIDPRFPKNRKVRERQNKK